MIQLVFKSYVEGIPSRGYWDQDFLQDALCGEVWWPVNGVAFQMAKMEDVKNGCVLVVPAGSHADKVDEINKDIERLDWVVLILTSDEQGVFPVHEVKHPNKIIYLMTPHFDKDLSNVDRYIGEGFPTATISSQQKIKADEAGRTPPVDVFFAGQQTHRRRDECIAGIESTDINKRIITTQGFSEGLDHNEYYAGIIGAKIIPCPSGPCTVDSFRFFETLELGRIPLADAETPDGRRDRYWQKLFGSEDLPFEMINDWEHVGGNIAKLLNRWRHNANVCFSWWQNYKREFVYHLHEDIKRISGAESYGNYLLDNLTVLVSTSPIRRHPSLDIIRETLDSIRERLPHSEIIIMIDGIREEQEYLREQYEEYVGNLLWMINSDYMNVVPILFTEHMHQSGMTRKALENVRTPTILYVEHDTPLCGSIDFEGIVHNVAAELADVVRLHHETHILVEHEHMMLDTAPIEINTVPMMKTVQWSQRPHVSRKNFYQKILSDHFSPEAKTMIEDVMHGIVHSAYTDRGRPAWADFKLWMYTPDPNAMKRSTNLDGRGDEEKYGMVF